MVENRGLIFRMNCIILKIHMGKSRREERSQFGMDAYGAKSCRQHEFIDIPMEDDEFEIR